MTLRPWMLLFVLATAGCLGTHPASNGSPSPTAPAAHGWTLDCALGSYEATPWNQTCEARASHTDGPKEEMWTAVNPKDPNNVLIGSKDLNPDSSAPDATGHCVWNGVAVTHDGGKHWKDVTIGGKYADRTPSSPFYGYSCNTDPDFQFTSDGQVHYGVEMYGLCVPSTPNNAVCQGSEGWKILLATSMDGGDTWPLVITYQPDLISTTDYSRMTINPKSQAILESIGSGDCHVMVSKDGGKSAVFYNAVSKDGSPCSSNNGAIAGSPNGVVVIVGNNIVARSTDDGQTWTDSNKLPFSFKRVGSFKESKYRTGSNLELAYDLTSGPARGTLYTVYSSADRDEADIFVRSSKDDGKTWSDAVLVNDDPAGSHQWMPNIAVAGDGSVHIFFMDKRYDSAHTLIDITHAVSLDGGKTWKNERVSTVSYDGDLGVHQDGFPFIGDYLGVAAVGNDVWAGFPDTSIGSAVTAAAHVHLAP